jgi:hypothetical protein
VAGFEIGIDDLTLSSHIVDPRCHWAELLVVHVSERDTLQCQIGKQGWRGLIGKDFRLRYHAQTDVSSRWITVRISAEIIPSGRGNIARVYEGLLSVARWP